MKLTHDPICKQKIYQETLLCFQKGLTITPTMEENVISALKQVGVTVIISPIDADAQLTNLCVTGVCQAALTENLEILVYSMISTHSFPILHKFENTGVVQVTSLKLIGLHYQSQTDLPTIPKRQSSSIILSSSLSVTETKESNVNLDSLENESISLKDHFTQSQSPRLFLQLFLLLGCKYVNPIPGINLDIALQVTFFFV